MRKRTLSIKSLLLRRFARAEGGATAIEFAILGPVFFGLVGASLETAMVFFAGQALDSAVHDSARLVRTGQVQQEMMNADQYRETICSRLLGMFDCAALRISVREIQTFSNFNAGSPTDPDTGEWTLAENFQPGTGTSVVLVEAYYKWPAIVNIPGLNTGVTGDGKRLLGAARVFRNEPFT